MEIASIHTLANKIKASVQQVIVGKDDIIDKLLVAIIAGGHVLLEDVPGTGKTLLVKALARSIEGTCKRVQFTPDLLPSDLSGVNMYNPKIADFEFRAGPVFTNLLLADEINRATPRTQSSLLECMEERQVSIDGVTMPLAQPFMVLATQNPLDSYGTFPLPEAQLDRFMLKLKMGYPSFEEGLHILSRFRKSQPLEEMQPAASIDEIIAAQQQYTDIYVDLSLLEYILKIIEGTRKHHDVALGASPRASQALLRAVQAHAVIRGRSYVTPDDVKAMAIPVLGHRLLFNQPAQQREKQAEQVLTQVINQIPVPAEQPAVGI